MSAISNLRAGLCSVTFRSLAPEAIIDLSAEAGLACIEWGANAPWAGSLPGGATAPHVVAGALDAARDLGDRTRAGGLEVASFGSYLAFMEEAEEDAQRAIEENLQTAVALGAPRMRVWAGFIGSADASGEHVARIIGRLERCVARGQELGVEIGTELHGHTLTDTLASALRLLDAVPGLTTYWQPRQDAPDASVLADLDGLGDRVSTIHVFSWWPAMTRLPLVERESLWREVVRRVATSGRDHDLLLEFVPDDDPASLAREARVLTEWMGEG